MPYYDSSGLSSPPIDQHTQSKTSPTTNPDPAPNRTPQLPIIAPPIPLRIIPRLHRHLHHLPQQPTARKMSHITPNAAPQAAPWSHDFQSHITHLPSPEFVLATLHPSPPSQAHHHHNNPPPFIPRLRYCIYRGMWATLPPNAHNPASLNPAAYTSDMPTFTTDVRMSKVHDLFATSSGGIKAEETLGADKAQDLFQGSGGGGPVEAVWWIKEVGVQWRVRGRAYVIAEDIDWEERQGGKESSGVRTVKSAVGERMRVVDESKREEWSWQRELTGHFGNCSPGMRGSWRNPPPGTPTEGKEPDEEHRLGQKVEDLRDPVARANFRVVVIKPDEVERLELSDPATARRLKYIFQVESEESRQANEEKGYWKTEELWP